MSISLLLQQVRMLPKREGNIRAEMDAGLNVDEHNDFKFFPLSAASQYVARAEIIARSNMISPCPRCREGFEHRLTPMVGQIRRSRPLQPRHAFVQGATGIIH